MKKLTLVTLFVVIMGGTVSVVNIQLVEADPKTVFVDDNNVSGPWDGSAQHPYRNITSGLEHTSPSGTIFVYNGTYYERIHVNESISLVGENKHGTIIDGNFTGTVMGITVNNVNVTNFTIRNGKYWGDGIHLDHSRRCHINNNIIRDNLLGIKLTESTNNTIADNFVICPPNWDGQPLCWDGVIMYSSNGNVITNNTISSGYVALYLGGSDYNTVNSNKMYSNWYGIRIHSSSNNTIVANEVFNSTRGIYIASYSSVPGINNLMYHNSLINNTLQATEINCTNIWHSGYPSGGNYWSDYNGTDVYRGPFQNITGGDGIGDTPYVLPVCRTTNNSDQYPLMKPYGVQYDIGITNTITSKTLIGQGYNVEINTRITSYGVYTETFNITAYANTTVIDRAEVTLTTGNSTVITFTWNTSGFAKGNYTITTIADPVAGEWDIDDNTYTNGIIKITIPGDLDGDSDVDLHDAVKLLTCYGAKEDDPDYDPNLNINCDGRIDLYDAVILLTHYGQRDP